MAFTNEMKSISNIADSFEWLICQADYALKGKFLDFATTQGKRKRKILLCTFEAIRLFKGLPRPFYYFACQLPSTLFEKENEYLVLLRETEQGLYHNTHNESQYYNLWPLYDYREMPLIIGSEQDESIIIAPYNQSKHLSKIGLYEYCDKIVTQAQLYQKTVNFLEPEYLSIPANSPMAYRLFEGAEGRLRIPGFIVEN